MAKKDVNIPVIIIGLLGLGFVALTFIIHWLFIIPAVIIMILNQRILFKGKK